MSMHSKPKLVEAVMFFSECGICKEMMYLEFEALLDGVVNIPEFADKKVRAVFVIIDSHLLVRAVVFFYLVFDENGRADKVWNIPLQSLAERAECGPDFGAGPIRLACRRQCPESLHQTHLWDPSRNDLVTLRNVVKRNKLGLLVEPESNQSVDTERLQVVSEDKEFVSDQAEKVAAQAQKIDQEYSVKMAQLIQQHKKELAESKLASEEQMKNLQVQVLALHQALHQQEELNANLKAQWATQVERSRSLEGRRRTESDTRRQTGSESNAQLQAEVEQLKCERDELIRQGVDQELERMVKLGVTFVVDHPGAGRLTIALQDVAGYLDNPVAYAAAKCSVSEEQYRRWLVHYQLPSCRAILPNGERCGVSIDRVDTPNCFIKGESDCCERHKVSSSLRTVN